MIIDSTQWGIAGAVGGSRYGRREPREGCGGGVSYVLADPGTG